MYANIYGKDGFYGVNIKKAEIALCVLFVNLFVLIGSCRCVEAKSVIKSVTGSVWEYTTQDSLSVQINDYIGEDTNVIVPKEIDGLLVTSIGEGAFEDRSDITSITLPKNLYSIKSKAFKGCSSLKSISIPFVVSEISGDAFAGCKALSEIKVSSANKNFIISGGALMSSDMKTLVSCPKNLKELIIPKACENICDYALSGCTGLTSINVEEGNRFFSTSGGMIFEDDDNKLAAFPCADGEVTLVDGITEIGCAAFAGCTGLKTISIPKSVQKISPDAFDGCGSLTRISVSEDNPEYMSIDGVLFNKDGSRMVCFPSGKDTFTLSDELAEINSSVFSSAFGLKKLVIPGSIKKIEEGAFDELDDLTLYVERGSYAEKYAVSEELPYIYIDKGGVRPSKITVVKPVKEYTGKAVTPTVFIRSQDGRRVYQKDYDMIFSNNVNVGKAKVTCVFKNAYTGYASLSANFNIVPKGTSITGVTVLEKGIKVNYKKQKVQTNGYEICYSAKSSFAGSKTKVVSKASDVSCKLTGLKTSKQYYVKVRTYRKIASDRYYSGWSSVKSAVTK